MSLMRKITISVPPGLVDDLDYLAGRMGVSRSAIISEVLSGSLEEMRAIMEQVPENPTQADVLRMRGDSAELVRQRLASLQGIANDLFAKP